jgi:hypothetical protein
VLLHDVLNKLMLFSSENYPSLSLSIQQQANFFEHSTPLSLEVAHV